MPRTIGTHHREKRTVEDEERPTRFHILDGDNKPRKVELKEVGDELDWLVGKYPISYREITDMTEDISAHAGKITFGFLEEGETWEGRHPSQIEEKKEEIRLARKVPTGLDETDKPLGYRDVTPGEDVSSIIGVKFTVMAEGETKEGRHASQVRVKAARYKVARKVPDAYDGVRPDDTYVAMMGGSGHMLVAGLATRLQKLGGPGKVFQATPYWVAHALGVDRNKDKDAERIAHLFLEQPQQVPVDIDHVRFFEVLQRDIKIANVKACYALRKAAQKARISHRLRLRGVTKRRAYADPELYTGAKLEMKTLSLINGDRDAEELEDDETEATRDLLAAVEGTEVWQKVFKPITGIGPAIAGGIISATADIIRFKEFPQYASYCGVGMITHGKDGKPLRYATIQRRRSGENSGWNNDARKCFWNFRDQCIYRKDSVWGQHLLKLKAKTLELHPVPVQKIGDDDKPVFKNGKPVMRYTTGHIHKIACWILMTDLAFVIWRQWKRIHKYPGDLYYTKKKNDLRPPGNRNTPIDSEPEGPDPESKLEEAA